SRAKNAGLIALNATIRADNRVGLAYYSRMGFQDYAVRPAVPLADGSPVDRISKRFDLG
ncbi:MAG: GNAT family N-acetyltransferase, partial [Pseudomonadota bacterium]